MSVSAGGMRLSASAAWRWAAVWLVAAAVAVFALPIAAAQDAAGDLVAEESTDSEPDPTEDSAVQPADGAETTEGTIDEADVPRDGGDSDGNSFVVPESPQSAPSRTPLEKPVDAGRNALNRWLGYPWYDRGADDLRPIKLPKPPSASSNWDFEWLKILAWGALAVCLLLLAYYIVRAYLERERKAAKASPRTTKMAVELAGIESLPFEVRRPRAGLLEEARRHYEAGNYAEAIIYLFSHRLVELDRHQVIRLAKGKTNRQYLREAGPSSPVARILDQTMGHFEAVFFGKHSLPRADFEACWNEQATFDQLLAQPVGAVAVAS